MSRTCAVCCLLCCFLPATVSCVDEVHTVATYVPYNNNGSPSFGTNRTYQFGWEFRDEEKENGREEITESSLESLRVIRRGTIILLN